MSTVVGASERGSCGNWAVSGFWTTTVPPGLFDAPGAFGAVEAGAGQDDGDQALAEDPGGARQEQVNRGQGGPAGRWRAR